MREKVPEISCNLESMENEQRMEHMRRTRFLKPIDHCNFTASDMISGLFASLSPALISSVNQLHGDRKGVVRVTCKNLEAVNDLDTKVAARKLQINGVRLAPVTEAGCFVRVTLTDVPEYISTPELERELGDFGAVVHSKRECMDYHGYRVENETRHILFSYITKEIPATIKLEGQEVFVTYHRQAMKPRPPQTIEEMITNPDNIPRHVINNMREQPPDSLLTRSRSSTPKPGTPLTEMEAPADRLSTAQSVPNTPKTSKRLPLANSPYPTRRKLPASSVPNLHEATQTEQDDFHTRAHGANYVMPSGFGPQRSNDHNVPVTVHSHNHNHNVPVASVRLPHEEGEQPQQQPQQTQTHGARAMTSSSSAPRLADDREMESHL